MRSSTSNFLRNMMCSMRRGTSSMARGSCVIGRFLMLPQCGFQLLQFFSSSPSAVCTSVGAASRVETYGVLALAYARKPYRSLTASAVVLGADQSLARSASRIFVSSRASEKKKQLKPPMSMSFPPVPSQFTAAANPLRAVPLQYSSYACLFS